MNYSGLRFRVVIFFSVALFTFAANTLRAENLTLVFDAPQYRIVKSDNGEQVIEMDDFNKLLIPGKPSLPVKTYMIALPPGATVTSVDVTGNGSIDLEGSYRIRPASPLALASVSDSAMTARFFKEWQQGYDATYLSDEAYPKTAGEYRGSGGLRKYTFARVIYTPFSYQPVSGRLSYTPSVTISINYDVPAARNQAVLKSLRDTKADRRAAEFLVNYDQARSWYKPSAELATYDDAYSYVIIYADGLQQVAETYRDGHPISDQIALVSVPYIDATYTGADLAERIRNYLKEKYLDWGIQWVLLLGDVGELPMRYTYPNSEEHQPHADYRTPTDHYYSDLDLTWDEDGDGYYGEYGDDLTDFTSDVYVGRIPYSDPVTAGLILDKIRAYQYDTSDWKNNALLLSSIIGYENMYGGGAPKSDLADLLEVMITNLLGDFSYITEYEKEGLDASIYECDFPLNQANAVGQWAAGDFGIVNWCMHGRPTETYRFWWEYDDGDGVPDFEELPRENVIEAADAVLLDNSHPSLVFAASCKNACPEEDNLAKNLLKNGASGIVAGTWFVIFNGGGTLPDDGGCFSIDYYFFHYMIAGGQRIGEALANSKANPVTSLGLEGWYDAVNQYSYCLYGDPYTHYAGEEGEEPTFVCGDANGDGEVTQADVGFLIAYLHKDGPAPDPMEAGDANGDGHVNQFDCKYLIEYLHKDGPEPICPE